MGKTTGQGLVLFSSVLNKGLKRRKPFLLCPGYALTVRPGLLEHNLSISLQRFEWWRVRDSNPRSIAQLIYSQSPLATRETRRVQSGSVSEPSRTGVLETLQERHIRLPNLSGKSQNLGQLAIIGGSFPSKEGS